jgi:hypothetical protein
MTDAPSSPCLADINVQETLVTKSQEGYVTPDRKAPVA